MSTPTASRPPNDTKAASIAWAVAAIVVALVAAFIAWLALGDRGGSDTAGGGPSPAVTQEEQPEQTPGEGEDPAQDGLHECIAQQFPRKPASIEQGPDQCRNQQRRVRVRGQFASLHPAPDDFVEGRGMTLLQVREHLGDGRIAFGRVDH